MALAGDRSGGCRCGTSRVARGERQSDDVEASLERELKKIMVLMKINHNGNGRNGATHASVKMTKKKALIRVK